MIWRKYIKNTLHLKNGYLIIKILLKYIEIYFLYLLNFDSFLI